jgi:hypothetical chaperone protein
MSKHLYGIDFGTSNSVLCIFDEETKELIDTITVPSILYFPDSFDANKPISYFIGEEAIMNYVKDGMKGRFMKSIKRVLPRSNFTETRIHAKSYNASDLISLILKDLKQKADTIIGYDCKKAIIGRPVFFDEDNSMFDNLAQKRLLKAAEIAGLTEVRFQFEPIGAAFAYEKNITKKEQVLVADLGGGTTDFTFIKLDPNRTFEKDRRKDIIATGGIYIGGDSFDSALMWDKGTPNFGRGLTYESMPGKQVDVPPSFFSNICSWEKMNFFNGLKVQNDLRQYYSYTNQNKKIKNLITLTENNLGYSIFQSIEKTKVELSKQAQSTFEYHALDIDIEEHISITDYNTIINKDILKIRKYLLIFLEQNNIKLTDIDTLFITGGSSLVLAVQDLFKSTFPNTPIKSDDNFISVAKGLAYSGYLFQ